MESIYTGLQNHSTKEQETPEDVLMYLSFLTGSKKDVPKATQSKFVSPTKSSLNAGSLTTSTILRLNLNQKDLC